MLMREERTLMQRVQMALVSAAIFAAGVAARVVTGSSYQAVDLGLEGSLVMGMLGGYVTGLLAGVLISIPAMFNGELMSMPLFAAAGVLGGLLRDVAPDKEAIWKLTFPDQALFRLLRKRDLRPAAFSLVCVLMILLAEFLRSTMARLFPSKGVFALQEKWTGEGPWLVVAVYATTLLAVMLPIKIWNSKRYETQAGAAAAQPERSPPGRAQPPDQSALPIQYAELRRLADPPGPGTSAPGGLQAFEDPAPPAAPAGKPDAAARRALFHRRLPGHRDGALRRQAAFVSEIDPATLDLLVPSMLLQPLVENSIRHGLSSKVDGGTIRVRSRIERRPLADPGGRRRRRHPRSQAGAPVRARHRRQQRE